MTRPPTSPTHSIPPPTPRPQRRRSRHRSSRTGTRSPVGSRDVEAALIALTRRQDDDAERAAARERVIERQHADIERMRTDERFGLLQPVLVDLCTLRNDLLRQAAALPADFPVERMGRLLESFAASVEDALLRCGSNPSRARSGCPSCRGGSGWRGSWRPTTRRLTRPWPRSCRTATPRSTAAASSSRPRVAVHRAVAPAPAPDPAEEPNATKEHVDA